MELSEILIGLFVLAIGVGAIAAGWVTHQSQQSNIQQSVQVEGTVEHTDVGLDGGQSGGYYPDIVYTYTHEGQKYRTRNVYPGSDIVDREKAEKISNQFSVGETTTVYVNRENPSRAFLIEGESGTRDPFYFVGIGAIFALGGLKLTCEAVLGD